MNNQLNVNTESINKFNVLPSYHTIPSWAKKALYIALIVAAVALVVFGIMFAGAPSLIGTSALYSILKPLVAATSIGGGGTIALGALSLHNCFKEDKKLVIRREMAQGKEEAIRKVESNPDLMTVEIFFEYVHPNNLSKDERKRLSKLFKKDSPQFWQRTVAACLNSYDPNDNEAKIFFDNMKDTIPSCLTYRIDYQDRLSQYLKAIWLKKNDPKEDSQILNLLYYSSMQNYPPASAAIFMQMKSRTKDDDIRLANRYLEIAGSDNHSQALCLKAARATKIPRKEKENYQLNLKAAQQGSLDGIVNVIRCLRLGLGVKKDENKADTIAKAFHIDPSRVKPYWKDLPDGPQIYENRRCNE